MATIDCVEGILNKCYHRFGYNTRRLKLVFSLKRFITRMYNMYVNNTVYTSDEIVNVVQKAKH